jgi:hypothetical protein
VLKEELNFLLARTNPISVLPSRRFGKSLQYSALMAVLKEAAHSEDERLIVIFQTDGDQFLFLRDPLFVPSRMYHENGSENFETDLKRIEKHIAARRTEFSLNDVITAAEKSRATIYSIIPGLEVLGRSPEDQVKQLNAYLEQSVSGASDDLKTKMRRQFEKETPETLRYMVDGLSRQQFALTAVSTASGGWTAYFETPAQADGIYSSIFSDINRRYIVGYYSTNKAHDGMRRAISFQVREHPEYKIIGRRSYYAAGVAQ